MTANDFYGEIVFYVRYIWISLLAHTLDGGKFRYRFPMWVGRRGRVLIIGIAGRATGISAIDARYQWATNARPVREAQSSQMEAVFNEN